MISATKPTHPLSRKRHAPAATPVQANTLGTLILFVLLALFSTTTYAQENTTTPEPDTTTEPTPAPETTTEPTTPDIPSPTLGMRGLVKDLILPGTKLEAVPLEDRHAPFIVRVAAAWPHGDQFRYDIEFFGLDPGDYDLAKHLRRVDGSSTEDLAAIPVTVRPVRAPGKVDLSSKAIAKSPPFGGYKVALILAAILWFFILLILLFAKRAKKQTNAPPPAPPTVAETLHPLLKKAQDGELDKDGQAQLERTLLRFWRRRRSKELNDLGPAQSIAKLREDEEAGPLIQALERWLHRPGNESNDDTIKELLKPYDSLD